MLDKATKWKHENGKIKIFKIALLAYLAMLLLVWLYPNHNFVEVSKIVFTTFFFSIFGGFGYLFFCVIYDPIVEYMEKSGRTKSLF
jgi:hypothetical protein